MVDYWLLYGWLLIIIWLIIDYYMVDYVSYIAKTLYIYSNVIIIVLYLYLYMVDCYHYFSAMV